MKKQVGDFRINNCPLNLSLDLLHRWCFLHFWSVSKELREQWPSVSWDTICSWQLCRRCCSWLPATECEHWRCVAWGWSCLRMFSSSSCRVWAACSATAGGDGSRDHCHHWHHWRPGPGGRLRPPPPPPRPHGARPRRDCCQSWENLKEENMFCNFFLFVKVSKLNFAPNSKSICLKEIAICFRNLVAVFIDGRKNPLSDVWVRFWK